ncbi:MAG TPA: glycoside hydrolase family protein [Chthoniobacteraceae bacterium]|jgi:hypothetical protein|nr:glycoside hydrolase family protein [Chthoniobacteraceae bacterium]
MNQTPSQFFRLLLYLTIALSAAHPARAQSPAPPGPDLNLAAMIQPVPLASKFTDPGYFVWCGSMVQTPDGKCHLFYSRWPRKLGFDAWVTHSEIAHAIADNPLGPYHPDGVALPERGKEFWDGLCTHNPAIMHFGDAYYLYYMGDTGANRAFYTQRNNQRIGVAIAKTPDGPWQRFDKPLIAPTPGFYDALCCANPAVLQRPGGGYLMVYKGVGKKGKLPFGGPVVLIVATAASPTGPFEKHPDPVFTAKGTGFAAEDPCIWIQDGHYWAVVKDMRGVFTHAGRSLALFSSDDGIHWRPARHPLVSTLVIRWADGAKQPVDRLERPQIFLQNGVPAVLFCAVYPYGHDGTFNVAIPLKSPP